MNYETRYYLANERQALVEIKMTDLPKETPKNESYKWLSISLETKEVKLLEFKAMSEEIINDNKMNIRQFTNGEARFDETFAKYVIDGEGHILMNNSKEELPDKLSKIINQFIKSF